MKTLEQMIQDKAKLMRELQGARVAATRCEGAIIYLDAEIAQAQKEAEAPKEESPPEVPKEGDDG